MARILSSLLLGCVAAAAFVACAVKTKDVSDTSDTCKEGCGVVDAGSTDAGPGVGTPDGSAPDASTRSAICGAGCDPDPDGAVPSCATAPPSTDGGIGTPSLDGGGPAPSSSGTPPAPPPSGPKACQLSRSMNPPVALATCQIVGTAGAGEACESSNDCGPGLSCITTPDDKVAGRCRITCCEGGAACPSGTYCANVALFEPMKANDPFPVPVCTLASGCRLLATDCAADETCTIVGDKTTTCVLVGPGRDDQPCPCAAGYVCAQQSNTCRKLCHTGGDPSECPPAAMCVAGSASFPEGFGICTVE